MPLVTDKIVPYPPVLPFDKQSVPVPGTKRPGQTGTWATTYLPGAPLLNRDTSCQLTIAMVSFYVRN